jgi:hypothetical protein
VLLACALRTLTPVTSYFVNPWRPRLFGKPFIVRVLPGVTTGAALYAAVWRHLRPFFTAVPRGKGGGGAGDERMGGGGSGVAAASAGAGAAAQRSREKGPREKGRATTRGGARSF